MKTGDPGGHFFAFKLSQIARGTSFCAQIAPGAYRLCVAGPHSAYGIILYLFLNMGSRLDKWWSGDHFGRCSNAWTRIVGLFVCAPKRLHRFFISELAVVLDAPFSKHKAVGLEIPCRMH